MYTWNLKHAAAPIQGKLQHPLLIFEVNPVLGVEFNYLVSQGH